MHQIQQSSSTPMVIDYHPMKNKEETHIVDLEHRIVRTTSLAHRHLQACVVLSLNRPRKNLYNIWRALQISPRPCQYLKVRYYSSSSLLSSAGSCGGVVVAISVVRTTIRKTSDDHGSFSYFSWCDSLSYHYMVRVYISKINI